MRGRIVSAWNQVTVVALCAGVKWQIFKIEYRLGYYPVCKRVCCLATWMIIVTVVASYWGEVN